MPIRFALLSLLISGSLLTAFSAEWKLGWADEFNGKSLDYSKWGVEVNAFGGGNSEMQIYSDRPENVRVRNGQLIIEAKKVESLVAHVSRSLEPLKRPHWPHFYHSTHRAATARTSSWFLDRPRARARLGNDTPLRFGREPVHSFHAVLPPS